MDLDYWLRMEDERVFPDTPALSIREDGTAALGDVYDGACGLDWDALCDRLGDRGLRVVRA